MVNEKFVTAHYENNNLFEMIEQGLKALAVDLGMSELKICPLWMNSIWVVRTELDS